MKPHNGTREKGVGWPEKATLGPSVVVRLGGVTVQAHVEKSNRLTLGRHIDEAEPW